jgi:drug/metabolite transporter (DMT)-like permease
MTRRGTGIALAFATATVSGFSIYLNGRAVKHFHDPTVYTTAKNAVAGILLVALALRVAPHGRSTNVPRSPRTAGALVLLAVVGGSVPFVLFFEGLSRAQATQAGFIQKTLVIWVALLAVPLLRERFRWPHALAVCLLLAGQAWYAGSAGTVVFGTGEAMILAATLLWAVEVVYVKRLLAGFDSSSLAAARMGLGTVLLLAWLATQGTLSQLAHFDAVQLRWIVLSGLLLTAYVATWYAALARAQAVDVTAVLVFGAVITAALSGAVDGASVSAAGTILITAGAAVAAANALRRSREAVV